ncbi:hypothetical protein ABH924_003622 [Arthrobacter sp. GAS37]
MSETRQRGERRSWLHLSPLGFFLTLIAALRILAQTVAKPDRADQNLLIVSTVVLSTVCLMVLAKWTYSLMKMRARRLVMRLPTAHKGTVFIARVDPTFLRALTPYSTNGEPVSIALANPVILISANRISIWKGVIAPVEVASVPRGSVGQTTLLQRRHLGMTSYQLETTLLNQGPDRSLTWRIQSLGLFGLRPAGSKANEKAIRTLEDPRPSV